MKAALKPRSLHARVKYIGSRDRYQEPCITVWANTSGQFFTLPQMLGPRASAASWRVLICSGACLGRCRTSSGNAPFAQQEPAGWLTDSKASPFGWDARSQTLPQLAYELGCA